MKPGRSANAGNGANAVIVAFVSQKGGAGKTTACVNVAAAYTEAGLPAGVIDADPQESAAAWARTGESMGHGPGWLAGSVLPVAATDPARMRAAIERVERAGGKRILIDCPPSFAKPALAAAALAHVVVIPCGPSTLDLFAAASAKALVEKAQAERGGLPRVLFLPTLASTSRLSRELLEALGDMGGAGVLPPMRRQDAYTDATSRGRTVIETAPTSAAAADCRAIMAAIERQGVRR